MNFHSSESVFWDQPRPLQPANTRNKGRSTTGCSNCKKRKVKCDEGKPTCSRCHDRRLQCPGYPVNALKWSSKHEVLKSSSPESTATQTYSVTSGEPDVFDGTNRVVGIEESHRQPAFAIRQDQRHINRPVSGAFASSAFVLAKSSNSQAMLAGPLSVPSTTESALDFRTMDPSLTTFGTSFEDDDSHSAVKTVRRDSYDDYADTLYPDVADLTPNDQELTTDLFPLDTGSGNTLGSTSHSVAQNSISLVAPRRRTTGSQDLNMPLSPLILHIPTVLVEYYFRNVCRECSTFDSSYNPFRSMIAEMHFSSPPIHHVIQSLAASKLADDMPRMKVAGIEAQGKALEYLKRESMAVNGLQNVSEEVLCTILLLGMTTSWHVREDLGVEYLILARRIVIAKSQTHEPSAKSNLEFYQNAIKYWSMIVSIVSEKAAISDEHDDSHAFSALQPPSSPSLRQLKKIMPHPWTGISPDPQQLFGQVLQLIRSTRGGSTKEQGSVYSIAGITSIFSAIAMADRLETRCWSLSIPSVDEIEDTGDTSTPPIHHVLTAKGYLLSALLHIYMVFPDALSSRIHKESTLEHSRSSPEADFGDTNMAHIVSTAYVWPERSAEDARELWLRDIGIRIVECLEQIDVKSGTRVVHPPLLLSVASALTLVKDKEATSQALDIRSSGSLDTVQHSNTLNSRQYQNAEETNLRVHQCRAFIIHRLETMHALMRFHAIDNILKVVKEVWRRADAGSRNIFWMEIMHELRCETLFG